MTTRTAATDIRDELTPLPDSSVTRCPLEFFSHSVWHLAIASTQNAYDRLPPNPGPPELNFRA